MQEPPTPPPVGRHPAPDQVDRDRPTPDQPVAAPGTSATNPSGARTFPCESCGADLTFNIGAQSLKCPWCGFVKQLRQSDATITENEFQDRINRLARLRDQGRKDEEGFKEITCGDCGGTVRFTGTITSTGCPYCGSPMQLDDAHDAEHRIPVDAVLPFLISHARAAENLRAWVQSRWFAPNDFKKQGIEGKFTGIYLPYWTYDAMTFTQYKGMRGEHYWVTVGSGKNRRRVRKTRWYPAAGDFQRFFDDVLVVAGTGLRKDQLAELEPWPLDKCIPFTREVLAGFVARTYDVELGQGFIDARRQMDVAIEQEVRQRIGGDTQRVTSIDTACDAVTYKHVLLPTWMLAYRYRDKSYQVVINAGTGEVHGDRPWSWVKIALFVLTLAAIGAGIGLFMGR